MNNDEYIIKYNDDYVHYEGDYLYVSPFKVHLIQNIGGTISATPMTGYKGDTVTLSNTADENYEFLGYNISGSTLYDTNKFNFDTNDVNCEANWYYNPPPPWDTIKIGGQLWSKDITLNDGGSGISSINNKIYYTYGAANRVSIYASNNYPGWHLPTDDDWAGLIVATNIDSVSGPKSNITLKSKTTWPAGMNGTDDFGFQMTNNSYYGYSAGYKWLSGTGYWKLSTSTASQNYIVMNENFWYRHSSKDELLNIRLVKDII